MESAVPRPNAAQIADPQHQALIDERAALPALASDLVIASVTARSPLLTGADWIRIDGALPPLEAAALRRKHAPLPALLDIPGPRSRRARSPLTTTESLVVAASEDLAWVNLSDLLDPGELKRARFFVGDRTRLSCTVGEASVLQRHLDDICEAGDALILDLRALGKEVPPTYLEVLLHAVLKRTREHGTPTLLMPGLAPRQARERRSAAAATAPVAKLLAAGARGLILTGETEFSADAQAAIDLARELIWHARESTGTHRSRHSAQVVIDGLDDPSGWLRTIS